jgi:hypothetical protein
MRTRLVTSVIATGVLLVNGASAEGLAHLKKPLVTRAEGLTHLKRPMVSAAERLSRVDHPVVAVARTE